MSTDKLASLLTRPRPRTDSEPYEHWLAEAYMDAQDARIAELEARSDDFTQYIQFEKEEAKVAELEREIREAYEIILNCNPIGEGIAMLARKWVHGFRKRNAERENGQ